MRIRVIEVLDLLAGGLSREEVLEELPDLESEDISAALQYASRRLDHPVLAAGSSGLTHSSRLRSLAGLPHVSG
jgi:hypothetical protein